MTTTTFLEPGGYAGNLRVASATIVEIGTGSLVTMNLIEMIASPLEDREQWVHECAAETGELVRNPSPADTIVVQYPLHYAIAFEESQRLTKDLRLNALDRVAKLEEAARATKEFSEDRNNPLPTQQHEHFLSRHRPRE